MIMSSVFLVEVKKEDKFLHVMCFDDERRRFVYPRKIPLPILRTWVRTLAPAALGAVCGSLFRCLLISLRTLYACRFLSHFLCPPVALIAAAQIDNRLANKCARVVTLVLSALRKEPKDLRPASLKSFFEHSAYIAELWPYLGSTKAHLGRKMNTFGWSEDSERRLHYSDILSEKGLIGWGMGDSMTRLSHPFVCLSWDAEMRSFVHGPSGGLLARNYNSACLLKPKPVVAIEEGDGDDAAASRDDDAAASNGTCLGRVG